MEEDEEEQAVDEPGEEDELEAELEATETDEEVSWKGAEPGGGSGGRDGEGGEKDDEEGTEGTETSVGPDC